MSGLLRAMRRLLGWILLGGVLTATAASVYSLLQDEKYSATASLLLQPAAVSQVATDIELAGHGVIARRTKLRLQLRGDITAADAVSSIEVHQRGESSPVEIEAIAGDSRSAALVANTFAAEYAALRRETDRVIIAVDRATPPPSPSSPKPVRNTIIGGLAGLLVGLGFALVREKTDRRLRDPRQLEEAFGLPVLARLPSSDALSKRFGMACALPPLEAEAFRMLRANLRYLESDRDVDSVLITSAAAQDGRSTVAFNLAAAAAAPQLDVLLIEAGVRRPTLARSLGLPPEEGLTSVLAGELPLSHACQEVLLACNGDASESAPTMDILPAGEWRSDAIELVESDRMRELLRECRRNYSLVVIDTPPAGLVSEAISLMSDVSAVIVVSRVGKLTGDQAAHLRDQLEQIEAPTFGIVVNFTDPNESSNPNGNDLVPPSAVPSARL